MCAPKCRRASRNPSTGWAIIPSIAAQRMSGSRSYLILALNDRERTIAEWRSRQGSDWVDQMLLGGMLKCAEHGYRMIFELVDTHNDHVERELTAAIAALQPDGVILTPPHSDNPLIAALLDDYGIPFAQIGSSGGEAGSARGIPLIMGDAQAASDATQHLIDLGHQRIGFITGPDDYMVSRWRKTGWRSAMEEADLPIDDCVLRVTSAPDSGRIAASASARSGPAANCHTGQQRPHGRRSSGNCTRARTDACRTICRSSASTTRRSPLWPRLR